MVTMVRRLILAALMLSLPLPAAAQEQGQAPDEGGVESPGGPEAGATIEGRAVALNGGTLVIDGKPLRLFGIEVPNVESAEGRAARINLDDAIDGRTVTCQVLGIDRNQMRVARCAVADEDLSLAQLMAGVVAVNRVHTRSDGANETVAQAFDEAEAEAREAGVGLWRTEPGLADVVAELKAIAEQEPKVVVQPAPLSAAAAPQAASPQQAAAPGLGDGVLILVAVLLGVAAGFGLAFFGTWWLQHRRAEQARLGLATALYEEILGIGRRMHDLAQADDTSTGLRAMLKTNSMVRTRTLAGFNMPAAVIYTSTGDRLGELPAEAVAPVVAFHTAVASLAASIEAAVSASPTEQLAAPQVREFAKRWLEAEERGGAALQALRRIVDPKGGRASAEDERRTTEALRAARQEVERTAEAEKPSALTGALRARPDDAGTAPRRAEPTV
jgi:endonuclease YncB( thermonuclease family)